MEFEQDQQPQRSTGAWQWTLIISIGMLIAVTSFAAGVLAERGLFRGDAVASVGDRLGSLSADASVGGDQFPRLKQVLGLIESEYYGWPLDPTQRAAQLQDLENHALQGMMQALDGYSTFLVPVEQGPIAEKMSGEYEGIGVWVESPNGLLTIVAPMPGSPAEAVGLQAGDIIEAADGHPLKGVNEQDALTFVRGPAGTSVRLTIRRAGVADQIDVDVMRQKIPMPAVLYNKLPDSNLAHIKVTLFGDKTTAELDQALAKAKADAVAGIILDLRNNGGGWVQSSQEMIGRFVPEDTGVALYEDVDPNDAELTGEPIVGGGEEAFDIPMVVLINGGTASASEIVAGALRDYGRVTLVGEKTFGKGSVQRVHDFEDGSSARITFAVWLTPNKAQIQGQGLQPDIAVPSPAQGVTGDPQLDRAVTELSR
ncbi:MAG: carboxyl-terminal processing protease [Thermomicrobiales bacterium]|nr:carboxyl-terminal processing protease [Thermomicrobiales bacterium]